MNDNSDKRKVLCLICFAKYKISLIPLFLTGSGGDTIRQLMVQSGAHIELFRGPQPNEHEKLFTVRGSTQQIQLATQLIRQKVDAMVSTSHHIKMGEEYLSV